jgi:tetratricopeptide (TPR) repeat protein
VGERGDEFAEVIAHHLVTALGLARSTGDAAQAESLAGPTMEALRRAGERALRLDVAAAERHFAAALELAGADAGRRLRILPGWGETLLLRNRYREAAAVYEEAIAGLRASGEIRAAALAMVWLVDVLFSLGEPSSDLMRAAVALLADDGPSAELSEVLSHYALALLIQDADPLPILEAADRAIETSRVLALPEPAVAMSCRGGARLLLGDRGGLEDLDLALAAAKAQGLGIERATLEVNLTSQVFAVRGAPAERAALLEAHDFVSRHGIDVHVYSCRVALVDNLYKTGDWDEALRQAALLLPELEATEQVWNLLFLRSLQALLASSRGEQAEAASFLDWLAHKGRESEVGWARSFALLAASTVYLRAGDGESALGLLAECFSEPRAPISIVEVIPEAVRTALAAGSDELAAGIAGQLDSLLPVSRLPLEQHVMASIQALLGERRAEYESAAVDFAAAAAGWRDFGMPYEEGQALLGRGRCLTALGDGADAAAPLAAAREIFARLGARPALEETDAALGAGGL